VTDRRSEELRRLGAVFSRGSENYERLRSSYPRDAVSWLLRGTLPDARVSDVGSGTGKLTAALLERGLEVVAVDPAPGMLEQLTKRLPQARTRLGSGEDTGLADQSVEAAFFGRVAAAQLAAGRILRGHPTGIDLNPDVTTRRGRRGTPSDEPTFGAPTAHSTSPPGRELRRAAPRRRSASQQKPRCETRSRQRHRSTPRKQRTTTKPGPHRGALANAFLTPTGPVNPGRPVQRKEQG